ncbi:MAG: hypothetical protein V1650_01100 [Candidatus Omnitrophota bacterium]
MRAIALISGGLDSTIATKLIKDLGIELIALNTVSPFCLCNQRSSYGCVHGAKSVADALGIKLISINVTDEFLAIVKKPKYGYGSNMNPCIDCRILLFKKAKEMMIKEDAAFVITGEVADQRPMSQKRKTMSLIDKQAGLEGLVLRPLSAKVMPETIPEKQGWVDRSKLLAILGRRRRVQMDLADKFGINDYPCPSGGCLLTVKEFSLRLKDLLKYNEFDLSNINLLKLGRHFRLSDKAKLIVGRDEPENRRLVDMAAIDDCIFMAPQDVAGPTALGRGKFDDNLIKLASSIVSYYCDAPGEVIVRGQTLNIEPIKEQNLEAMRV